MRQKLPRAYVHFAVVVAVCFGDGIAFGQTAETPSHRRIPLGAGQKPPAYRDFLTPEMLELRKELNKLKHKQRLEQRQSRSPRRPGESSAQRNARERQMAEDLQRNMPPTSADDISEEIRRMSEQLGQRLGGELAETVNPDAIPFDPTNKTGFWDRVSEMTETVRQKERLAKQEYEQAKEIYEKIWPSDAVAPDEWLRKVQPFVNEEVVKQIADASAQFESQKHLPPSQRIFSDYANNPSGGSNLVKTDKPSSIFDSFMKSIDKQGTDWLKSKDKKPKSNFWKSFSSGAKNQITKLNRTMTENSKNRAGAGAVFQAPSANRTSHPKSTQRGRAVAGPTGNGSSGISGGQLAGWLLAATAIVCVIWCFLKSRAAAPIERSRRRLKPETICDRESLLAACHALAIEAFGFRSRFWNHRQLFRKLTERVDGRKHVVTQLGEIYERARYSPDRSDINDLGFERARNLFSQVQRGMGAGR